MIFILANEIGEVDAWDLHSVHAIEKLAQCAFDGSHIVITESVAVVNNLLATPLGTFSAVTVAVLKKIAAEFSFQGWLEESGLECTLVTTPGTVAQAKERSSWVLSLTQISAMSLEPTTLLAENLVDAKIFEIAARHHVVDSGLRGFDVSLIARGGGGSTIVPELEQIVNDANRICFAITDSDKTCPGADQSSTSKKCQKLVEKAVVPVGHGSIPVRELENLIPPSVLNQFDTSPGYIDAVREFAKLCDPIPEVREFGDIKDGVSGSKLFNLPLQTPERAFLHRLLVQRHGAASRCANNVDCELERNGADCKCICVPKVGPVSQKFHDWLSLQSAQKSLEAFKSPWRDSWLTVGFMVFSWCCSRPRMRG